MEMLIPSPQRRLPWEVARRLMAQRGREREWRGEGEERAVWLFHLRVTSISRNRAEYHECQSVSRWMAAVGRVVLPVRGGGRGRKNGPFSRLIDLLPRRPWRHGAKRKRYVVSSRVLASHFQNNAIALCKMKKNTRTSIAIALATFLRRKQKTSRSRLDSCIFYYISLSRSARFAE